MRATREKLALKRQVLCLVLYLCVWEADSETIRYSVFEEMEIGSVVANVAKDLGLKIGKLSVREARVLSERNKQYFEINRETGDLFIKETMDREELCGQIDPCTVNLEILLENPLQMYRAEMSVYDVNDHSPMFFKKEQFLKILETSAPGSRFPLQNAQDLDVGNNSIQNYSLSSNTYFHLYSDEHSEGRKYAELVLDKALDREHQPEVTLLLTAVDGGSPPRSGTAQIHVIVLDANDNLPVFSQAIYKARVLENSPKDYLVVTVCATDLDEGNYGEISYSFSEKSEENSKYLNINPKSGEIRLQRELDFEAIETYQLNIQATDGGGRFSHSKVLVEVVDVNDNAPEVKVTSLISPIPEDSSLETVVAILIVRDRDSGDNGKTVCTIQQDNVPFVLKPTFQNYHALVIEGPLDREKKSTYDLSVTAVDFGSPSLTTQETVTVELSDINDNPPVFNQTCYVMYIKENNNPAVLIGMVNATDIDSEQNAKLTYSLASSEVSDFPLFSSLSINSENGNVYVLRSMDYEDIKEFQVAVRAADGGSPPLTSEVIVRIVIFDENDNAPFILYPLQNSTSPANDLVPRSAEVGYLVTKVVAVDRDSGQNSWLSYQLLKATDPGLFIVNFQNGEIRTTRLIAERDSIKQKLIVLVRDNGASPLSSSATLNILLVDGFSDPYMQFVDSSKEAEDEQDGSLTVYLVLSLCLISFIFLVSVIIFIIMKIYKRRMYRDTYILASGNVYGDGNFQNNLVDITGTGTLSQSYPYEVCLTSSSGNSEFKFLKPIIPNLPDLHVNSELKADKDSDFPNDSRLHKSMKSMNQVGSLLEFKILLFHFNSEFNWFSPGFEYVHN
ncbi:protocadherin beta-1-like [Emydura macquarii macquarii]|uniref:protocadherin beta-1-like n=1 Tax=Emydura macquarii macquarii TaxID=1129001 RepID=UPI00352A29C0